MSGWQSLLGSEMVMSCILYVDRLRTYILLKLLVTPQKGAPLC